MAPGQARASSEWVRDLRLVDYEMLNGGDGEGRRHADAAVAPEAPGRESRPCS